MSAGMGQAWRERLQIRLQEAWDRRDREEYEWILELIRLHEWIKLQELADQTAARWGIPRADFRDCIACSNWDPHSQREFEPGKVGVGLGHLTPDVARYFGLVVNDEVDERYDPAKNLEALAGYITSMELWRGEVTCH